MNPESLQRAAPATDFERSTEEIRAAGIAAAEMVARYWDSLPRRRVVPDVTPRAMEALFDEALPEVPSGLAEVLREVELKLEPNVTVMGHPRYFAFVNPGSTPIAPWGDALAAAFNQNLGAWRNSPAGTSIERRVVRWLASLLGMPVGTGGLFVSGGSMANMTGLGAAVRSRAPWDVRRLGIGGGGQRLTMYASSEVHRCVMKAADLLGLGEDCVRLTPVDALQRADVGAMAARIQEDRAAGAVPVAIIGSAGTVNSGAVDPLEDLAALARAEDLWFHVDGSYGALAALSPTGGVLLRGLGEADTIAFDPHKWLFIPYEAGVCLARDPEALRRAFGGAATYMKEDKSRAEAEGERMDLFEYGPQLSRGFKALKVWMSLKAHGRQAYAAAIEEHLRLARVLDAKLDAHPRFERVTAAQLSISCFRWVPPGAALAPEAMDRMQEGIAAGLERSGEALMSGTRVNGRAVLRTCILSYRTREADLDLLLGSLDRIGHALAAGA